MTNTSTQIKILDVDPFSRENILNPYPLLTQLREEGPVTRLAPYGTYAVAGFDEVYEVLTDFETFISGGGLGLKDIREEESWRPPSILESDPPIHTVMRRALTGVINPGTVRALREPFTPAAVEIVSELSKLSTFDANTDLAERYPIRVFPDAVGIPQAGREHLLPYGNMVFNAFGPENDIFLEAFEGGQIHSDVVMNACERENLGDTGFGAQIWSKVEEGIISQTQATLLVRALLSAGVDSTILGIGNIVKVLASYPDAWAALRQDRSLLRFAVDEALRLESPFQKYHRTVTVDTVLGGVEIPAGSKLVVFLGAANRDPLRWGDDADTFNLDRNSSGHVAFGMGLHQCIGQPIARLESEIILEQLLNTFESIELVSEPTPLAHNVLRGFTSIPVAVSTT